MKNLQIYVRTEPRTTRQIDFSRIIKTDKRLHLNTPSTAMVHSLSQPQRCNLRPNYVKLFRTIIT